MAIKKGVPSGTTKNDEALSPTDFLAKKYFDQGEKFFTGNGAKTDFAKAVANYAQSAKLGYAPAIFSLGVCYIRGFGVTRDEKKAFELISQAAEMGNVDAQFTLGHFYFEG